jgi:hypothetical protein
MQMTTAETTATDTWTDEIAALKARYPHVRDPILAALNLLLTDPNITDDDAKARAAMRGKRPTAPQAAHGSRARDRQVADMRRIDVGPRPAGRDALAAWYAEALDVQRASGLSVAEFAPRVGVSAPTFYAWRRRLAAATPRELPAQLVELTVARGSSPAAATGPMVVQLCAGRRSIEVPAGFDGAELQRLVAAIESC